jgi:cysteate synthase
MGEYLIKCVGCKSVEPPHAQFCQNDDSLLRTEYFARQLTPRDLPGIWKFYDWLPVMKPLRGVGERPVTYKSEGLAKVLGLENLYISFSGYWPERNVTMSTCSFKDLEAPPTIQHVKERGDDSVLVVASIGNTARAFAQAASLADQPLVLVVPEKGLSRLWITTKPSDNICVVAVDGNYNDAIDLGGQLASQPGFISEGGARNVARRDGMGVVMLEAALTMKTLPQHYFQAVGSGTGGIAAWEASLRLIQDGRFGQKLPKLHLAQNLPCAPIFSSWTGAAVESKCPEGMYDDVLFNKSPPYDIVGGVKDALQSTGGRVYGITHKEAADAQKLFEEAEEIDIVGAAAIAVAAIRQALESNAVNVKDSILLNITGGGISRLERECDMFMLNRSVKAKPGDQISNIDLLTSIRDVLGRD